MSIKLITLAWELEGLNPGQKLVLIAMADQANDDGYCWPSVERVAKKCSMGIRTIHRHLADLEQMGLIVTLERPGASNVYTVTPCQNSTPANLAPHPCQFGKPLYKGTVREPSKNQQPATPAASDVDPTILADWVKLRKAKRAPVTATAIDGIRNEAAKAGITLQDAMAMCCQRGWTGFKADWVQQQPQGRGKPAAMTAAQQSADQAEAVRILGFNPFPDSGVIEHD